MAFQRLHTHGRTDFLHTAPALSAQRALTVDELGGLRSMSVSFKELLQAQASGGPSSVRATGRPLPGVGNLDCLLRLGAAHGWLASDVGAHVTGARRDPGVSRPRVRIAHGPPLRVAARSPWQRFANALDGAGERQTACTRRANAQFELRSRAFKRPEHDAGSGRTYPRSRRARICARARRRLGRRR